MNPVHQLLTTIDPSKARIYTTPPVQRLGTSSPKPPAPKPAQRPAQPANGASEASALKRKASGPVDAGQNKIARKDAPAPLGPTNGAARSGSAPAGTRSTSTTPTTTSMPYRGTAASKPANPPVKKPLSAGTGTAAPAKTAPSAAKPAAPRPAASASGASAAPAKKVSGYLAMLQKAKQKEATKPAAPLIKHEPTKIMTKKDREQARLAAKSAGKDKGKKPVLGAPARVTSAPARATDPKADVAKDKRKPADVGYQGTARPAKKPVEVGYKGTARAAPSAPAARSSSTTTAAVKKKPQAPKDRYSGYANWSDLDDDMEGDEEEDGYGSDASSDMEGGIWDVEKEEAEALKAAKREDAEALAEENAHKREKLERQRKLAALSAKNAGKRKF